MRSAAMVRPGIAKRARPETLRAKKPGTKPHVCFVAPHAWPVLSRDPAHADGGRRRGAAGASSRACSRAHGHRVSMISLDYGQPRPRVVDGVTVHKTFRAARPACRCCASCIRASRRCGARCARSTPTSTTAARRRCWRRRDRRVLPPPRQALDLRRRLRHRLRARLGGQIRYARDRWLYRRGLRRGRRASWRRTRPSASTCREHLRPRGGG